MRFEFATATRIVFGAGTFREIGALAKELTGDSDSTTALVVTGRTSERAQSLASLLQNQKIGTAIFSVQGEPAVDTVRSGLETARKCNCSLVIGIGGGSAIDAGKAIAALFTNPGDPYDYLEVVGKNQPLTHPPLPYIAVPTTAGTGAEVTRNAVLASPEHKVKVSLRSPLMLPKLALVDPELTYSMPPAVTASTGLDALTQLIEAYVSIRANPLTDALSREGIRRAARSLAKACHDGTNAAAREDMSIAGLTGGLVLANAVLGAVHGLAGPMGGMFPAPHGAACAALLPHVMAVNLRALRERQPGSSALQRYADVAALLTNNPDTAADHGIEWIRQLCDELNIPSLREYGMTAADRATLVAKGQAASSMKGNPIALTPEELGEIVQRAL